MPLDPDLIRNRIKCERNHPEHGKVQGWVIGVLREGRDPGPYKAFEDAWRQELLEEVVSARGLTINAVAEAKAKFDLAECRMQWRRNFDYYVAADEDGQELLREEPFRFPASAMREGLMQARFFPDGIPDVLPFPDERFPDADIDPTRCQVTQSQDPVKIATWWWTWNYGGFPHWK